MMQTLSSLGKKYWIIRGVSSVSKVLSRGGVLEDVLGLEDVLKDTF